MERVLARMPFQTSPFATRAPVGRRMGLVNLRFAANTKLHVPHVQMEFSEITPDIFVGTNQCCRTHYRAFLLDRGVAHDVSLEGEHVDAPYGAESYLWLPTEDHTAPTLVSLHLGVDYIDDVLARGGKVFIHCKNGHGRGPTLAAAWFVAHGKTVEDAVRSVSEKRKEVHLEVSQAEALRAFARERSAI